LLVRRVREDGWRVEAAAAVAAISERSALRWLARHPAGGELALQDRSSAPARCLHRTDADTIAAIEWLRRQRMTGPAIAARLNTPRSTVGALLRRLRPGRLSALDAKRGFSRD
jgi:transposase